MPKDKLDKKLETILRRLVRDETAHTTPRQLLNAVDGRARKGRKFEQIRERLRENNLCTDPDWETCPLEARVEVQWNDPELYVTTELIAAADRYRTNRQLQHAERVQSYLAEMEREKKRNEPSILTLILREFIGLFS